MPTTTAHGQCLCGAVRFTAQLPSKWMAHCHCSRCQRAHGAAFVTWVGFEATQIQIDDAQHTLRWFENPTMGNSQRGFCNHCGSPMFFRSERYEGELHIARALFTTALDRTPESHVYYDSHVDWVNVNSHLPIEPD